jgi:hypothetical protein
MCHRHRSGTPPSIFSSPRTENRSSTMIVRLFHAKPPIKSPNYSSACIAAFQPIPRTQAQRFILQAVVAMFAEDIDLLPAGTVQSIVNDCLEYNQSPFDLFGSLFRQMNSPKPAPAAVQGRSSPAASRYCRSAGQSRRRARRGPCQVSELFPTSLFSGVHAPAISCDWPHSLSQRTTGRSKRPIPWRTAPRRAQPSL